MGPYEVERSENEKCLSVNFVYFMTLNRRIVGSQVMSYFYAGEIGDYLLFSSPPYLVALFSVRGVSYSLFFTIT